MEPIGRSICAVLLWILAAPAFAQFTSLEFGALEPGDSWTHIDGGAIVFTETVLPGFQFVHGVPARIIEVTGGSDPGERFFITNDSSGIRIHGGIIPEPDGGTIGYRPPLPLLPASFGVGSTLSLSGSVDLTLTGLGTFVGSYNQSLTVAAIEQVSLPAGTLNVIRVDTTQSQTFTIGAETLVLTAVFTDWWAKNIGPVKSAGMIDGELSSSQLISTTALLCGDVNNDRRVDAVDVRLFREFLAGLTGLTTAGGDRCTVIDPPSECDLLDLAVIRRVVEGPNLLPGIFFVCHAAIGPL